MKTDSKGFVLISVVWVVALLTIIVLGFGHRAMLERRVAAHNMDRIQAQHMARGAVQRGMVELRNKAAVDRLMGLSGRTSFDQRWKNPPDLIEEEIFQLGGEYEIENEICEYEIQDEEGLISVNHAAREVLENLEGIGFRAAGEIISRQESTGRHQRAFMSIEEIRDLDGVDDRYWEGTEDRPGLRDLLTVWGNDGRININTAPAGVLEAIPELDRSDVEFLLSAMGRDERGEEAATGDGIGNITHFLENLYLSVDKKAAIERYGRVDSSTFTVTGVASQRQGAVQAKSVAAVQVRDEDIRVLEWREDYGGA